MLLGYFVGQSVEKASGYASDAVLGLIVVILVVLFVRHRRKEKRDVMGTADAFGSPAGNDVDAGPDSPGPATAGEAPG